jgi:hypothetical protein
MPCYSPLSGFRSKVRNPNGKRNIVFKRNEALTDMKVELPCGQCVGCRLEKSRQWAMRMMCEAQMYDDNCFLTLTYDQENLPDDGSLVLKHFQDFMKRLRSKYPRAADDPIRYFHCGEYGGRTMRPHYHAIVFNFDFDDKYHWSTNSETGDSYYRSEDLEKLWTFGNSLIGEVTFESAAYCARYVTKKLKGAMSEEGTKVLNYETGELLDRTPEYATMSRRPGIGKKWFEKFKSDAYPSDFLILRDGVKMQPPKYYDKLMEDAHPVEFARVKGKRKKTMKCEKIVANNTIPRLRVREEITKRRAKRLQRSLENEDV